MKIKLNIVKLLVLALFFASCKSNHKIVDSKAENITAANEDTKIANKELKWKTDQNLETALQSAWEWQLKQK